MATSPSSAIITARILLEIKAINFRPEDPYTLTSGWKSPVYIDCRRIISFPRARRQLMTLAAEKIAHSIGYESIDAVIGGETAGIPFAAWIADMMLLPMAYVRKKPKGFGRNAQIEGFVPENANTLLVEDLTTDGMSKLRFAEALRRAGLRVDHTFVIFFYDIFPDVRTKLEQAGLALHALCSWHDVLAACEERNYFSETAIKEVRSFLDDPYSWSAEHGGVGSAQEALLFKKQQDNT